MLTKSVLESQTVVELPAREMLAFLNIAAIFANQQGANVNTQVNAYGGLQANLAGQSNTNAIVVFQN